MTLLWLAISLPSLLTYPTPDNDEPLFSSVAFNFLRHGNFGIPVFGDINGSSQDFVFIGKAHTLALAAWFRFLGVSLFTGRLFPLMGGLLMATIVWRIGRKISGPTTGLIASALTLFAWKTFYASHHIRPDIWIAVAGAVIYWLYVERRGPSWLLGFVAGISLSIHLPLIFFIVAISLIQITDWLTTKSRRGSLLQYSLGLALGLGLWLASMLLPDPARTIQQYAGGLPGTAKDELNFYSWSLATQSQTVLDIWNAGFLHATRLGWVEVATTVISGLIVVAAPTATYRRLLLFTFVAFTSILISPYFQLYYLIMFTPLFSLIIAIAASHLAHIAHNKWGVLLAIPLLVSYLAGDVLFTWNSRSISHRTYADAVRAYIPPEASILADGGLWFDLANEHAFTIDNYILYAPQASTMTTADWLRYVFISRNINLVLKNDRLGSWYTDLSSAGEKALLIELSELLTNNCHRLGVVTDWYYGVDHGGPALKQTEVWQCPALQP